MPENSNFLERRYMFKSRAKEWVERTLLMAKLSARKGFKREMEKRIDYYFDRQLPYLRDILTARYADADALGLEPEFINVIKTIVDSTALVYRSGAARNLTVPEGEASSEERELWNWLMANSRYEATMKTLHRMVKLCRTVLIKPAFRKGAIKLDLLTPDQIDVIQDPEDPLEAQAFVYTRPRSETAIAEALVYHYWDRDHYRRFTANGEILPIPGNPDGVNPYGELPFVRFSETLPISGYFVDAGEDMTAIQDAINLKLVQLNHLIKMQSFSVPVLIGYDGPEKIVVAPGKPIKIPLGRIGGANPDFKFESPNPAITECLEVIREEIARLAHTYHISSANFSIDSSAKSGFALVMENLALFEERQNTVPFYEDAEEELFDVIKRIWNAHAPFLPSDHPFAGVKFGEGTRLSVTIQDVRLPQSPQDEAAEWRFLIENKMATPIDYMMLRFQMTREEARAKYAENLLWFDEQAK